MIRLIADSIKRGLGLWDSKGLKHSSHNLRIALSRSHKMSIYEMSRYVDEVVFKHIELGLDVLMPLPDRLTESRMRDMNMTALGNLAHIALYSCDSDRLRQAKKLIAQYRAYQLEKFTKGV